MQWKLGGRKKRGRLRISWKDGKVEVIQRLELGGGEAWKGRDGWKLGIGRRRTLFNEYVNIDNDILTTEILTTTSCTVLGGNEEAHDLCDTYNVDTNAVPTMSKMTKKFQELGIFYNHAKLLFIYGSHLVILKTT